jgi:hypothetical protein
MPKSLPPVLAAKVWCPSIESEPEGAFNPKSCTGLPSKNWFCEDPEFAARLYALELSDKGHGRKHEIHVRDNNGNLLKFDVQLLPKLEAQICPIR